MSQSGAAVMAKKGKKYDEILKFYYTGVNIINLEKMWKYAIMNWDNNGKLTQLL